MNSLWNMVSSITIFISDSCFPQSTIMITCLTSFDKKENKFPTLVPTYCFSFRHASLIYYPNLLISHFLHNLQLLYLTSASVMSRKLLLPEFPNHTSIYSFNTYLMSTQYVSGTVELLRLNQWWKNKEDTGKTPVLKQFIFYWAK